MKFYIAALVVCAIVLAGHFIGIDQGYYVSFPLYDVPMHILGGLGIGLFGCAFARSGFLGAFSARRKILIAVFMVGIIWEVFEVYFGIVGYPLWSQPYFIDSISDLINDMIGGSIAVWLVCRRPFD